MERAFKGIWIPAEIWLNKDLTLLEKVFLVEIDSLDNENGCFASNEYFSNFFGLSKNRCSEVIKSLEKKGIVTISYIYKKNTKQIEKRIIKIFDNSKGGIRNLDRGIRNLDRGYSENCEDNNTLFNNTINNTTTIRDDVVDVIKKYFSFSDKEIKEINKAFNEKNLGIEYLEEKLKMTKNNPNIKNVVGYLINALKNDYKTSINNAKCFIPQVKTRFHNINQSFMNYSPDELEKLLQESQKGKFQ